MKIHVLAENRVYRQGLLAEHGLSLFIEHQDQCILFDTGYTDVFCTNAARMGVDLTRTRYIILSHGHYDHCGGLPHFPRIRPFPGIFVHPAAFARRWAGSSANRTLREIGIPWSAEDRTRLKQSIIYTQQQTPLFDGAHLLSEISGDSGHSSTGFYAGDSDSMIPDGFIDEQMLVIETPKGLVLFLGCSHPGVVSCLRHVQTVFPGQPIHALVAGMHMSHTPVPLLTETLKAMMELGVDRMIPLHCTGIEAITAIRRMWGDHCIPACVGDSFEL